MEKVKETEFYKRVIEEGISCILLLDKGESLKSSLEYLKELESLYGDRVSFLYSDSLKIGEELGIYTYPSLLIFKDGLEKARYEGLPPRKVLEEGIKGLT